MPISRIEKSVVRAAVKSVYGSGVDGDVTVSSVVTLTSDMFYNSLTITSSGVLLTNGYRVFVRNLLTLDGHIGIGSVSGATVSPSATVVTDGTVKGHSQGAITYRAGGQGGGTSAPSIPALPSYLYKSINMMLSGIMVDTTGTIVPVGGGSKGNAGATGSTGPSGAPGAAGASGTPSETPASWPGKAGAVGSNGGYGPSATTVNVPGGRGNPGADGSANPTATGGTGGAGGAGGAGGTGGAGGSAGAGGGVVLVVAKTIVGAGKVMSIGSHGSAGSAGSVGSPGSAGSPGGTGQHQAKGANGANGAAAPGRTDHHHVAPGHTHAPHTRTHNHHNHTTIHSDRHGHIVKPHHHMDFGKFVGHLNIEGAHWHHGGHYHHPHNDGPHGGVTHWDGHYWHAWRPHYNGSGHWVHYPPNPHSKPNGHHSSPQPDGNGHHHTLVYHGSFGGHDGHTHAHFGLPHHSHDHAHHPHSSADYHHHNHSASHPNADASAHYPGGAGGVNDGTNTGAGAPARTAPNGAAGSPGATGSTGATGDAGGGGGGGAILVVSDTVANTISYDTTQGSYGSISATSGSAYLLINS